MPMGSQKQAPQGGRSTRDWSWRLIFSLRLLSVSIKDVRVLLPGHYMNVTTVLTPAIVLLNIRTRSGRDGPSAAPPQRPSLIIPLQLKTDKLPIADGVGRRC